MVLHLAIRHTRRLAGELTQSYGAECPTVVVSRASQPDELVLRGTLADIADQVEAAGLRTLTGSLVMSSPDATAAFLRAAVDAVGR